MTGWTAIAAARHRVVPRTPFEVDGETVGSVALAHVNALRRWPGWVDVGPSGVRLRAPRPERDAAFAQMNETLHADGLIVAWRNEVFPLCSPTTGTLLATFERASARFWGTLTQGAHCNGYVAGSGGRPSHLWIARRSSTKATDPGKRDNLVGGGVPFGQSALETVVREGWEEAGLTLAQMQAVQPGNVIDLDRDVAEGRQFERVHVFDLALPATCTPRNQDGEVESIQCLPVDDAIALATGEEMTVDAALVTLDFALRHRLLPATEHERLAARMAPLWAG
jgi:8-oxo-dGTP pyrophosphatase MutT (NUDIX family)